MQSYHLSPLDPTDDAMRSMLQVDVRPAGGATLVVVAGQADLSTSPCLLRTLVAAGERSSRVLVDLDGLTFMDASALGVLVEARRVLTAVGKTLRVRCVAERGRRILALGELESLCETPR